MKGSKWQYIRDKCIEMGYTESAKIAQEIDDALVNIYGDSSTPAWQWVTEEYVSSLSLYAIIVRRSYCRGCDEAEKKDLECYQCEYGKLKGDCVNQRSQFAKFMRTYTEEEQCRNKQNKSK